MQIKKFEAATAILPPQPDCAGRAHGAMTVVEYSQFGQLLPPGMILNHMQ